MHLSIFFIVGGSPNICEGTFTVVYTNCAYSLHSEIKFALSTRWGRKVISDYKLFSLIRIFFGASVVVVVVVVGLTVVVVVVVVISLLGQHTERSATVQTVGGLLRIVPRWYKSQIDGQSLMMVQTPGELLLFIRHADPAECYLYFKNPWGD